MVAKAKRQAILLDGPVASGRGGPVASGRGQRQDRRNRVKAPTVACDEEMEGSVAAGSSDGARKQLGAVMVDDSDNEKDSAASGSSPGRGDGEGVRMENVEGPEGGEPPIVLDGSRVTRAKSAKPPDSTVQRPGDVAKLAAALVDLALYVEVCGGAPGLAVGWRCTREYRSTGRTGTADTFFWTPAGKRLRSHADVARFLGLTPVSDSRAKVAAARKARGAEARAGGDALEESRGPRTRSSLTEPNGGADESSSSTEEERGEEEEEVGGEEGEAEEGGGRGRRRQSKKMGMGRGVRVA